MYFFLFKKYQVLVIDCAYHLLDLGLRGEYILRKIIFFIFPKKYQVLVIDSAYHLLDLGLRGEYILRKLIFFIFPKKYQVLVIDFAYRLLDLGVRGEFEFFNGTAEWTPDRVSASFTVSFFWFFFVFSTALLSEHLIASPCHLL
jgi:hypothetical protein